MPLSTSFQLCMSRWTNILSVSLKIISYSSILAFVLGAQKNYLIEMVLLSTYIEMFLLSTHIETVF